MMANITDLPTEILVHIFRYYLETESQFNLLNCVGNVCSEWQDTIRDFSLWSKFDGSLSFENLKEYSTIGSLIRTEKLVFGYTGKPMEGLREIYASMPRLKSINFTKVKILQEYMFVDLVDECPHITELVVNDSESNKQQYSFKIFKDFFMFRGSKFVSLNFSYSSVCGIRQLFLIIGDCCPNLEELYLENMLHRPTTCFPIVHMQKGCTKLRVLCLGHPIELYQKTLKGAPGFPELEVFTHPAEQDSKICDTALLKILYMSSELKTLDIRGSRYLTVDAVYSLPCDELEVLRLSKSKINEEKDMCDILKRWCHTLKELDLSKTNVDFLDEIIWAVVPFNGMPVLERLNLKGTKVSISTVRLIVHNCKHLIYLNLESCRKIGRGKMLCYHGRENITGLLDVLVGEIRFV